MKIKLFTLMAIAALLVVSCRTHQPCPGVGNTQSPKNQKVAFGKVNPTPVKTV